jgi:hypothetical protein
MYSIALRHHDHTRQYQISPAQRSGWELTLQEDRRYTRQVHYEDWHRVERALAAVRHEVDRLTESGWQVVRASGTP